MLYCSVQNAGKLACDFRNLYNKDCFGLLAIAVHSKDPAFISVSIVCLSLTEVCVEMNASGSAFDGAGSKAVTITEKIKKCIFPLT